jgi:NAD/NADP transhydrogenase alpha subunit
LFSPGERYVDPDTRVIVIGYTDLLSRMAQQSSDLFAVNMYNLVEELCFIPKNSSIAFYRCLIEIENTAANFDIDLTDEIVKGLAVSLLDSY